jgi:energy-coupling factor transporter transmembrane protein EcfT
MDWLIDSANTLYILLAICIAGLVVVWRFNQRVKFLFFAGIPLLLILLLFLVTQLFTSDSKQLEENVNEMAAAVQQGKVEELFKHISKDFNYKGMTRDVLHEFAAKSIQRNQIKDIAIRNFKAEVIRPQKLAKTRFLVKATGANNELHPFVTEADFVLEGERWMLKTVRFYNPLVNQDQEIGVPGL